MATVAAEVSIALGRFARRPGRTAHVMWVSEAQGLDEPKEDTQ